MLSVSEKQVEKSIISKLENILGKENVLSSYEERYCYAFDATASVRETFVPDIVVLPENKTQVSQILKLAHGKNIPVIARGAGTNHVGACIAKKGGIVIHFSKMNNIIEIDRENLKCKVQPGVVVGDLQKAVESVGLFYPPDPSNLAVSTIGGSIALCSSGPRTFKYGSTKDYIMDLEVVLADGTVINTGAETSKNVTGYNLTQLFVGSEGTLGIVTEATIKLIPKPESKRLILAYFDSIEDSANAVTSIIAHKFTPSTLDLIDKSTLETIEKFYPSGLLAYKESALLIELDGDEGSIENQQLKVASLCKEHNASDINVAKTDEEAQKIWTARRSSFAACAKLNYNVVTEDVVVPRANIPQLIKGIKDICTKYSLTACIMGHAGDGNIHPNFALDLRNDDERTRFNIAKDELFALALELDGTLSGEHGIGCEKSKYISKALSPQVISIMKQIKKIFDPKNILNPEKIF